MDYFAKYSSGIPVITDLVNRILHRLRVPLLKQIFAWMVFGELQDESKEFFIQSKDQNSSYGVDDNLHQILTAEQRAIQRLASAKLHTNTLFGSTKSSGNDNDIGGFDWYSSYFLRLENIPDSHVSPVLSTKIVFAGKAAKLLQTNLYQRDQLNKSDAFTYFSKGQEYDPETDVEADSPHVNQPLETSSPEMESPQEHDKKLHSDKNTLDQSLPYSKEEIANFDEHFKNVLQHHDRAVEYLEKAVELVCDTISNRLWLLLKDQLGFFEYLRVVRNTFLMGKGELMQCILDDVHSLTHQPVPDMEELDEVLNWKVLRNASKLVGLSDEDVGSMIKLRVSSNRVTMVKFLNGDNRFITMAGVAKYKFPMVETSEDDVGVERVEGPAGLFNPAGICLSVATPPLITELYTKLWRNRHILSVRVNNADDPWTSSRPQAVAVETASDRHHPLSPGPSSLSPSPSPPAAAAAALEPKYLNGAVWFSDTKYVAKGFEHSFTFLSSWNEARLVSARSALLNSQRARDYSLWPRFPERLLPRQRQRDLVLGTIASCIHGDPRNVMTIGSGDLCRNISNSIIIGVSFHAYLYQQDPDRVNYYARVFVARGGNEGIWKLPTNKHLSVLIGEGHVPASKRDDHAGITTFFYSCFPV